MYWNLWSSHHHKILNVSGKKHWHGRCQWSWIQREVLCPYVSTDPGWVQDNQESGLPTDTASDAAQVWSVSRPAQNNTGTVWRLAKNMIQFKSKEANKVLSRQPLDRTNSWTSSLSTSKLCRPIRTTSSTAHPRPRERWVSWSCLLSDCASQVKWFRRLCTVVCLLRRTRRTARWAGDPVWSWCRRLSRLLRTVSAKSVSEFSAHGDRGFMLRSSAPC